MSTDEKDILRAEAREKWIARFTGYFGDPIRLHEYRRGEITFRELHDSTLRHTDDMLNEAGYINHEAFNDEY